MIQGGAAAGRMEQDILFRQNEDLKRRLEDESASYKRRLETYRQAQQHQAALVSRLQAKVYYKFPRIKLNFLAVMTNTDCPFPDS